MKGARAEEKGISNMRHLRKYRNPQKVRAETGESLASVKDKAQPSNSVESKRARNVVDALFQHFAKWQPEVLCQQPTKDVSLT